MDDEPALVRPYVLAVERMQVNAWQPIPGDPATQAVARLMRGKPLPVWVAA